MNLNKETVDILKCFSAINSNLVIKPGKKFLTMSATKDMMAEYEGSDNFDKQISIFNLNEFLGVLSAFDKPELDLDDKFATIKEGKQKVKYVYADESLTVPSKQVRLPDAEIKLSLSAAQLARIQKMAGVLAVEDVAFIGDGKKVIARVYDVKNSSGNTFDIDLEAKSSDKFNIHFKVERIGKLFPGDYDVEISSKRISKFNNKNVQLNVFIAVESDSTFA